MRNAPNFRLLHFSGWVSNTGIIEYNSESRAKLEEASNRADFKLAIEQIETEYAKVCLSI